jgi:hypothetical protein
LDFNQENWIDITPIAQYALNDAESTATGETPNFVKDKKDTEGETTRK